MSLDHSAFIQDHTQLTRVSLRPDIELYQTEDMTALWQKAQNVLHAASMPLPFWATAWAGGQALARYILDHPHVIAGKKVLDFASGSGLIAIAAAKGHAAQVEANDVDPFAIAAIGLNSAANHADVKILSGDIVGMRSRWDVVLAGDVVYEPEMAARAMSWLADLSVQGTLVLIGDPGRTYLPRKKLHSLARYDVPVSLNLEDREIKATDVWTFKPIS